ncbi:TetR/AcrR family transcriptional regulator [Yinghuangia sp. YIM S09857]|uniref:TetR/AcrR family transcriptional regulator n=1 Tax=Yinghuangia sp. YIM S09857 TaxID=3436929 RepID=UPI003F536AD5
MAAPTSTKGAGTVRMSADERRIAVIRAALSEFAKGGFHGTSTAAIANRVGVSQPYLFRLFDDKKALFLATVEHGFQRVEQTFAGATKGLRGHEAIHAMAHAYQDLLDADSDLLRIQLQAYVAAHDPELKPQIRKFWDSLDALVRDITGADAEVMTTFFARGMLCNVIAAIDLPRERYFGDFLGEDGREVECERCWATNAPD